MPDLIYKDALPRLANGIRHCADVVAKTLGPKGTNVLIQHKLAPGHLLTNDGATIIQAMYLPDPVESMGLNFLKEAVSRSNSNSGDGSTTTCILLNAILQEGIKANVTGLALKESLDECLPIIEKALHDQTKEITVEDIPAVAEIAGESKELAEVLGAIYKQIGAQGIVHLEGSGTYETSFTTVEGVRLLGTGFLSPFMATEKGKATYQNPAILVTKRKIEGPKDINPLLEALVRTDIKTLVIFADDMDSNVARNLVELQKNPARTLNILIIKAPVYWKNYVFEDFAKITGATIVEDASGVSFKTLKLEHLGTCGTIVCDKDETTVIGIKNIEEHISAIKADDTLPSQDKAVRLAYLSTKTALLKLGAKSETELSYRRLKCEDAIHSSRLALQSGVVPGGGVSLRNCATYMPDTVGGNILRLALKEPIRQINEGSTFQGYESLSTDPSMMGTDAKTGKVVDMFEEGIVDAASVVLQAVRNSLGIASTLLTTNAAILLPPEKDKPANPFGV